MKKEKIFTIPSVWTVAANLHIKAKSLEEAERLALDHELPDNSNWEYLENSFELDTESPLFGEYEEVETSKYNEDAHDGIW